MNKNKNVVVSIVILILGIVLFMGATSYFSTAFAEELTTANTKITAVDQEKNVQKQMIKFMKKDGYTNIVKWETKLLKEKVNFISKTKEYKRTWKNYLTKSQKSKLDKNVNKVLHSYRLITIKKYKSNSASIVKVASALKDLRANTKQSIIDLRQENKKILNEQDKQKIKSLINKILKSYSTKAINNYKVKAETIISEAQERERLLEQERLRQERVAQIPYDTSWWSDDKIEYVLIWGPKNNSFLAGTAMDGLGWYIAAGAYDYDVDPALLSSIAWVESGCGAAPYGSPYNAYGWICMTPAMYSWEDGIDKWYAFFGEYFGGDNPVSSMHGYGGYGIEHIYPYLEEIRNA